MKEFLLRAKKFEWSDPTNYQSGNVIFSEEGKLSTSFGEGTWDIIDH